MSYMDSVWYNSFGAVINAISGVLYEFLRCVGGFSTAFELIFSLTIVYFVVVRLVPSSGSAGSDKVRKSSSKEVKK